MQPQHIKEQRKKTVRNLKKRRNEIYALQRKLNYIPLKKPEKYGWFKELILTEKVQRYKHSKAMQELFTIIKKQYWGRTKDKAEELWNSHTSEYYIYRDLPTISKKQYYKLSVSAQKLCTPFRYRTGFGRNKSKYRTRFYLRLPKSAYKIKYTRAYITHYKEINPLLESELDLIDQQLLKPGYYNLNPYSWKNDYEISPAKRERIAGKQELNKLKNIPLKELLNYNLNGKETERERPDKNRFSTE